MEIVSILRVLVRRRILVLAGLVLATVGGLAAAGALPAGGRPAAPVRSGLAESRVLVDTHSSYADDLNGGTEVLGSQAALLATLIAGEAPKVSIARAAGIAPEGLDVVVSEITLPKIPSTLARSLSAVVDKPRGPYGITVHADPSVSIITIEATAPTVVAAERLARAGTAALVAVTAASARSPARSLVIEQLGPVRSIAVRGASRRGPALGIVAAVAIFGLWCSAIIVAFGLGRAWRRLAPPPAPAPGSPAPIQP
jgi:hypothetical protein